MKIILNSILACALLLGSQAMAQKSTLDAAPVPATVTQQQPAADRADWEVAPRNSMLMKDRVSYGLSMGTTFGPGFGASYVEPTLRYQLSNRFRAFGGLTYMHISPQQFAVATPEGGTIMHNTGSSSHMIVNAGVDYLASERVILSGSIWRDFSNVPVQSRIYNGAFGNGGRMGADFRATYKITDHLSVTGGVRFSDGNSPFQPPFYGPTPGGFRNNTTFQF